MAAVVAVDLPDPTLEQLSSRSGAPIVQSGLDGLATHVDDHTVAVVADATHGLALAQSVHRHAPDAAVIFFADDPATQEELTSTLAISPGIGRRTRCVVSGANGSLEAAVDEIERGRLRIQHRLSLAGARRAMASFESIQPETLTRYLGQLFDHAPIGILLADASGTIQAANPCSADVLGWQPRHAIGSTLPTMFRGAAGELAADLLKDCTTTGEPAIETLRRIGPDGSPQHLEVTVAPVDPDRWERGVFVLLRDESARVHAIEVADEARREAEAEAARYAELARTLQESLLPPDLPEIPDVEIGARYHPAGDGSEIGGDFYDVFQVTDHEWFAVMGDVCGKGAGAARLTALSRYTLRATTIRTRDIERNLGDLNAALLRQYDIDRQRNEHRFATATVIRFRADGDDLFVEAGSGGHPPPLVVRADGTVSELACRGPLLGMFAGGSYEIGQTRLGPGDGLVLYTDGVTEARRGDEQFGDERLWSLLQGSAGSGARALTAAVEDAVLEFQSGNARDDIAVLAISAPG